MIVANYKERVCFLCEQKYLPTSPKQKYCFNCRNEGRKIADRKRDKNRSRKKYNYIEYTRNCMNCGVEFKTFYKKKGYCGAEECDKVRLYIKNRRIQARRPREYLIEKGRRYYKNNREECLRKRAIQYRQNNPNAKPYIGGRSAKLAYDDVKDYVESRGYKLLSDKYINNREKLLLECPNGHQWETAFHNFKDGEANCYWCYVDNNYISKFEESVREYINKIYSGPIIYNDRTQIISTDTGRNLELDIWFPNLNKAIECNGLYWHSGDECLKRDQLKVELCEQQDIDLLVITDKQWELRLCKNVVINFIGVI